MAEGVADGMSSYRRATFLALFFASGACGLVYEIVWIRMLVLVFGGTTFAVTTVLACFMAGLAVGSYLAGHLSRRVNNQAMLYGALEIGIGLYCLCVPLLLDLAFPLYQMLARASEWSLMWLTLARIGVSGPILLVPTALMGATLPLLAQAFSREARDTGGAVARLYGANVLGAFVGCAATGFFLLPRIGLTATIAGAAAVNVAAGLLAVLFAPGLRRTRRPEAHSERAGAGAPIARDGDAEAIHPGLLLWLYGLSGFAAMAYQVSWTRALILSIGASTYAFTAIVACFILGLALGSLLVATRIERLERPLRLAGWLEVTIGLSALLVAPLFGEMPGVVAGILETSGGTFGLALALEVVCVFGLLAAPTLCMGALLPVVCVVYESSVTRSRLGRGADAEDPRLRSAGSTVGSVYAANTLGTILGSLAAGFVLIPAGGIGMQRTILIASALSGVIGTVLLLAGSGVRARRRLAAVAAVWLTGIAVAVLVPRWSRAVLLSGPYLGRAGSGAEEVLFYREGVDATVAVTTDIKGRLSLRINGKTDASTSPDDMPTQILLSHIPMLLEPDATEVCIIGLGSGVTAGVALAHRVERVDVVEISGAVIEASMFFEAHNGSALADSRASLHRADGRNFLLLQDRSYDVIISEPSNPWISGVANLYTREFMELCRSRLKKGGLHCQWIHGYSMSDEDVASVLRTVAEVFPHLQLWETSLDDYLIIASQEPIVLDLERWYRESQRPAVRRLVGRASIHDPMQLAHHYVGEGSEPAEWIGRGRVLTDDLPHLEFSAPRNLLREEADVIAGTLSGLSGGPRIVGGDASPLARLFLSRVEDRRRARTALVEATRATGEVVWKSEEQLLDFAERTRHDARMCLLLLRGLRPAGAGTSAAAGDRIEDLFRRAGERAPCLAEMAVASSPDDLSWPLGERLDLPTPEEMNAVIAWSSRLYESGNHEEAIETMTAAVDSRPADPRALGKLAGWVLEAKGGERALPLFLRLLAMVPGEPETEYQLARASASAGDIDDALRYLQTAISHGFDESDRLARDPLLAPLLGEVHSRTPLKRATTAGTPSAQGERGER